MAFNYQAILDTYRNLQQEANAANESRYNDILDTLAKTRANVGGTYDKVGQLLDTLGDAQRGRIEDQRRSAQGTATQSLISRGLGNTTVTQSASRGINQDANRANAALTEQVGAQKAGVLQNQAAAQERQGNMLARMMEARTDKGPDMGMFAQLLQRLGAGQGANDAASGPIFTGLSANARAGLDVFGDPLGGRDRDTSTPHLPGTVNSAFLIYHGGSRNPARRTEDPTPPPPASNPLNGVGQMGSDFDNLFRGQPVYRGGNTVGKYTGDGTVGYQRELLDAFGNLDPSRLDIPYPRKKKKTNQGGS